MRRGLGHGGTALAGCAGQAFRPVLPRVALTVAAALGVGLPLFGGVDGTVVNQTTGRPQADVILMLMQPGESGMQQLGTAKTDAQGNFHFDKSPEGPKLLQAIYSGVLYTKMIPPGQPSTGVQVPVYNATKNTKLDHPSQRLLVLQPTGTELDVTETLIFDNQSNTTFNNPQTGSAEVWIPGPAQDNVSVRITPPGGMPIDRTASATRTPHIYKIDYPVNPGETRFDVNYVLPNATPLTYSGRVLDNSVPLRLVTPSAVSLQGAGIASLGREPTTQAQIYEVKSPTFTATIQGTGTLGAGQADSSNSAEDNGEPQIEEAAPRVYDRMYWVLGLAFGILALGSVLLWRRDAGRRRA